MRIRKLTLLHEGGYIVRAKDGILYTTLKHLMEETDDLHHWWISSKGMAIDDNNIVRSGLNEDTEVQNKKQPGFVPVRYRWLHKENYGRIEVQMEPGRFKPWRMLA